MILQTLSLIISAILWIFAPIEYSFLFCLVNTIIFFIVSFFSLFRMRHSSAIVLFNVLFLSAYFLTAFAYPTFIHPFDSGYFIYAFSDNYINKGTALSLFGASAYLFGCFRYFIKKTRETLKFDYRINLYSGQSITFLKFASILLSILLFSNYIRGENLALLSIFNAFFIAVCSLIVFKSSSPSFFSFRTMYFSNISFFILIIIGCLVIISTGDRGPAIFIFLLLLSMTLIQYKVKQMLLIAIPVIVVGVFLMFIIQQLRTDESRLSLFTVVKSTERIKNSQDSYWNFTSDLTNSSRNIYLGLEIVDRSGHFYSTRYIANLTSTIPFLPTILGINNSTTAKITEFHRQQYAPNSQSGMGTQLTIDIYLEFGIFGVLILMYFLGCYISFCSLKWENNIYALVGLFFLIGTSVYLTRSSLLLELRVLAWSLLIVFLNSKINKRSKYRFKLIKKFDENNCHK